MEHLLPYLIFFSTFSLGSVYTTNCSHRTTNADKSYYTGLETKRIIGGRFVPISNNPFVVSIVLQPKLNATKLKLICGGVIIQTNWALTASHCLKPLPPKVVTSKHIFVLGNTSVWDECENLCGRHYIEKFYIHENYTGQISDYDYDMAVLKVTQPFNLKYEKPIAFAGSTYKYIETSSATVYGWGMTDVDEEGIMSSLLKSTTLTITGFHECVDVHETIDKYITPRMICAWKLGTDTCAGDSGGPLVQYNTLIGIVSWGVACANELWPGVYTKVSVFSKWILEKISENS